MAFAGLNDADVKAALGGCAGETFPLFSHSTASFKLSKVAKRREADFTKLSVSRTCLRNCQLQLP